MGTEGHLEKVTERLVTGERRTELPEIIMT